MRSRKNEDTLTPKIILVALILLIMFLWVQCEAAISNVEFNDGICSCGGQYQYGNAVGHRYGTDYVYICDKCGKTIEISYKIK